MTAWSVREAIGSGGSSPRLGLVIALALLVPSVTGCLSVGQGRDLVIDSYEEARAVSGATYRPVDADSSVWLKVVEPAQPLAQERGQQRVVVLLFDLDEDRPVRDADLSLDARHDRTDRGGAPEDDPEHDEHGLYQGSTAFDRAGRWTLTVDAQLSTGGLQTYEIPVYVQ